jgi:hypothetical protein
MHASQWNRFHNYGVCTEAKETVFITETCCVLCKVWAQAEKTAWNWISSIVICKYLHLRDRDFRSPNLWGFYVDLRTLMSLWWSTVSLLSRGDPQNGHHIFLQNTDAHLPRVHYIIIYNVKLICHKITNMILCVNTLTSFCSSEVDPLFWGNSWPATIMVNLKSRMYSRDTHTHTHTALKNIN